MKSHLIIAVSASAVLLYGCNNTTQQSLWEQTRQLGGEKTELKIQVEQLQKQNTQLRGQVATLASLDKGVRLEALSNLEQIEIGKRSGIFDKDNDGRFESLVVNVRPFDKNHDTVKN